MEGHALAQQVEISVEHYTTGEDTVPADGSNNREEEEEEEEKAKEANNGQKKHPGLDQPLERPSMFV